MQSVEFELKTKRAKRQTLKRASKNEEKKLSAATTLQMAFNPFVELDVVKLHYIESEIKKATKHIHNMALDIQRLLSIRR